MAAPSSSPAPCVGPAPPVPVETQLRPCCVQHKCHVPNFEEDPTDVVGHRGLVHPVMDAGDVLLFMGGAFLARATSPELFAGEVNNCWLGGRRDDARRNCLDER